MKHRVRGSLLRDSIAAKTIGLSIRLLRGDTDDIDPARSIRAGITRRQTGGESALREKVRLGD